MNEMVERVARALWELETETDCPEWDQLADFRKNEARQKARAAIAAMREPTEDMTARRAVGSQLAAWTWRAMIDAALAAGQTPI